ncbi:hypothetical protein KIN20_006815 [Parelaphostrongylus tenuis]|uniref:Uncharacterized protein n=1 Tax=Parelaphostrongylus tenuis TaxID=148309 RepID=A0AAD5M4B2_PARTN|nr:hypothetical protein KIN20_006815 [Parelaphostrongylus tenuis]
MGQSQTRPWARALTLISSTISKLFSSSALDEIPEMLCHEVPFPIPSEIAFLEATFMLYVEDEIQRRPTHYSWKDVSFAFARVFKHFIEQTADHFGELSGKLPKSNDLYEITRIYHLIIDKIRTFRDFPFTWLRFCELLHDPSKHYRRLVPFMHALERVINVCTTTTSNLRPAVDFTISSEPIIFKIDACSGRLIAVEDHSTEFGRESDVPSFVDAGDFSLPTISLSDYSDDEAVGAPMIEDSNGCRTVTHVGSTNSPLDFSDDEKDRAAMLEDCSASSYLSSESHYSPQQSIHAVSYCKCGNCSEEYFIVSLTEIYSYPSVEIVGEEFTMHKD